MLNLSAFHDYDVRGVYPNEINEEFYFVLGRAFADYVGKGPIAVACDMRLSSPSLSAQLISGITKQGIDVVDLGMISTEMLYFSSGKYDDEAGVIVSASHNPPKYNGAKFVLRGAVPLHGSFGLYDIRQIMKKGTFGKESRKGSVQKKDIFDEWIDHALSFIQQKKLRNLKVVVDGGNGMGGPSWREVGKRLKSVEIVPLYLEPDGRFPNHEANPLKDENLRDVKREVRQKGADFGIALDGDADRIFFVDEIGEKLSGTVTTAILADHFLQKEKAPVLYNVICGRIVKETVERNGGTAVRTRVGHSVIKEKMRETGGIVGGEHSGHFYYRDNYTADSSLITGLLMMQILSENGKQMSVLRKRFDVYAKAEEMNFQADDIAAILDTIKVAHTNADSVDELDGLSVWYKKYWFNVRGSKTEPLLRLNVEADNETILKRVVGELVGELEGLGARML